MSNNKRDFLPKIYMSKLKIFLNNSCCWNTYTEDIIISRSKILCRYSIDIIQKTETKSLLNFIHQIFIIRFTIVLNLSIDILVVEDNNSSPLHPTRNILSLEPIVVIMMVHYYPHHHHQLNSIFDHIPKGNSQWIFKRMINILHWDSY